MTNSDYEMMVYEMMADEREDFIDNLVEDIERYPNDIRNIVQKLMIAAADLNWYDHYYVSRTVLEDVIDKCIENGAIDVNKLYNNGNTLIHILLNLKRNINNYNKKIDIEKIIVCLMTRGVRIGMKDNHGITIYDLLNNDLLNNDNLKLDQSYINMINEMNHAVQMKRNQMLALMKLKRLEGILPLELLQRVHGFQ